MKLVIKLHSTKVKILMKNLVFGVVALLGALTFTFPSRAVETSFGAKASFDIVLPGDWHTPERISHGIRMVSV